MRPAAQLLLFDRDAPPAGLAPAPQFRRSARWRASRSATAGTALVERLR